MPALLSPTLKVTPLSSSKVKCSWNAVSGALGYRVERSFTPKVVQIASNDYSTHFLLDDGNVWNCGRNERGQLGRLAGSSSSTVLNLDMITNPNVAGKVVQIAATGSSSTAFTYFLLNDGNVWNCGYNAQGQLGRSQVTGSATTVNLGRLNNAKLNGKVKKIIVGDCFTYFELLDGTVWNCGSNNLGQLGRSQTAGNETTVNLGQLNNVNLNEKIIQIACGAGHVSFLLSDGTIWNCGNNSYGELGRNQATGSNTTVNLGQLNNANLNEKVTQISCGYYQTQFRLSDGNVWNCGYNAQGQLGRVQASGSATSVNLGLLNNSNLTGKIRLAFSLNYVYSSSYFLLDNKEIWNCGQNTDGQLGRVQANGSATAVNLGQLSDPNLNEDVLQIADGLSPHNNLLMASNEIWNCGNNIYGQLARATANGSATVPNLNQLTPLPWQQTN